MAGESSKSDCETVDIQSRSFIDDISKENSLMLSHMRIPYTRVMNYLQKNLLQKLLLSRWPWQIPLAVLLLTYSMIIMS